jgi:putative inorganic carbon (hco3(-)) transporter
MRLQRLFFVLAALYLVFVGGAAYYNLVPAVRFFHHIFVTLVLTGFLLMRLRKGLPATPLNPALYAVVPVWFASALLSADPRMAVENLWLPLAHIVFFFILADLFQRGRERLVIETQYILAALVIFITALELGSWYFGWGIIPGTEIGWAQVRILPLEVLRVSLAMNISTLLAGYVAPLIIVCLGGALTLRQKSLRRVLWGMAALLLLILILTFSRGGWLSFAVAFSLFMMFRLTQWSLFTRRIPVRLLMGTGILALIGVLIVFIVFTVSQDRRTGDEGRVDMWLSAAAMTRDHPILGVGPGLYGRAFREYRDVSIARDKLASAHNAYLNTAAETGIVGIMVSLWLLVIVLRTWWQRWKVALTEGEKIRLEAAFAALVGLGVHSLVDTFTITPIVLVMLGLVAYIVSPRGQVSQSVSYLRHIPVLAGLAITVSYGAWFVLRVDPAYARYLESFRGDLESRLAAARDAEQLDPALNLYDLQIAYLSGFQTSEAGTAAYRQALALEPTWDVGWMNLGWLEWQRGEFQAALDAFTEAQRINPLTEAPLNRARIAEEEELLPRTPIVTAYTQAIANEFFYNRLPLSKFWTQTPLREAALYQYLQTAPLEVAYRVYGVHDPARAAALIPQQPETAAEWWVVGEYALTVEQDTARAVEAFTKAIHLDYANGDYYAARARALLQSDLVSARLDMDYAYLLGTTFEDFYQIQELLAASPEEAEAAGRRSQPVVVSGQEFAAVLYGGRASIFNLFPELRPHH